MPWYQHHCHLPPEVSHGTRLSVAPCEVLTKDATASALCADAVWVDHPSQEIQAAEDEAVGVSRALAVTRERLAEAVRVRDDLARRAGIDPAGLMPRADALPPAGEASLKYAQASSCM